MPSSAFPVTYEILVERNAQKRARSTRTVGTDAVDALWRVPGIDAVELLEDVDEEHGRAKLSYLYMGEQRFQTIDSQLEQFGLKRVKVEE